MARILRLLTRSWTISAPEGLRRAREKTMVLCKVQLLDGTDLLVEVPKKEEANFLLQRVFEHLDLLEVNYFGLQYTDENNINKWLEGNKSIRKQININENTNVLVPIIFRFKVKFYSSQPENLKEEITRYQLFLQVKIDIKDGRLPCPIDTATELAALALQSEFGDYDSELHTSQVISEFKFIPYQNNDFAINVLEKYKQCSGMSPATSETNYLNKARWLEMYGVDFHFVIGKDENQYKLGLIPSGILISEADHKIGIFYWPKITKLQFKKRKFIIDVVERYDQDEDQEHKFVFRLNSQVACKHLWKCSVEHHTFFRMSGAEKPIGLKQSFLRMGSKFRYSGHTELESLSTVQARSSVTFRRTPSQPLATKSRCLKLPNGTCQSATLLPAASNGRSLKRKDSTTWRNRDADADGENRMTSATRIVEIGVPQASFDGRLGELNTYMKTSGQQVNASNKNKENNFSVTGELQRSQRNAFESACFGDNVDMTSLASLRKANGGKGILNFLNASFSASHKAANLKRSKSVREATTEQKYNNKVVTSFGGNDFSRFQRTDETTTFNNPAEKINNSTKRSDAGAVRNPTATAYIGRQSLVQIASYDQNGGQSNRRENSSFDSRGTNDGRLLDASVKSKFRFEKIDQRTALISPNGISNNESSRHSGNRNSIVDQYDYKPSQICSGFQVNGNIKKANAIDGGICDQQTVSRTDSILQSSFQNKRGEKTHSSARMLVNKESISNATRRQVQQNEEPKSRANTKITRPPSVQYLPLNPQYYPSGISPTDTYDENKRRSKSTTETLTPQNFLASTNRENSGVRTASNRTNLFFVKNNSTPILISQNNDTNNEKMTLFRRDFNSFGNSISNVYAQRINNNALNNSNSDAFSTTRNNIRVRTTKRPNRQVSSTNTSKRPTVDRDPYFIHVKQPVNQTRHVNQLVNQIRHGNQPVDQTRHVNQPVDQIRTRDPNSLPRSTDWTVERQNRCYRSNNDYARSHSIEDHDPLSNNVPANHWPCNDWQNNDRRSTNADGFYSSHKFDVVSADESSLIRRDLTTKSNVECVQNYSTISNYASPGYGNYGTLSCSRSSITYSNNNNNNVYIRNKELLIQLINNSPPDGVSVLTTQV